MNDMYIRYVIHYNGNEYTYIQYKLMNIQGVLERTP